MKKAGLGLLEVDTSVNTLENYKEIENHRKSAMHLEKAAKLHLDAAKHHESGDHEKAAESTIVARGHVLIATKAQQMRHHALKSNSMTFKKILIGLMSGITTGTFSGIKLTSDKSIKARQLILRNGESYANKIVDWFRKAIAKFWIQMKYLFSSPDRNNRFGQINDEFD